MTSGNEQNTQESALIQKIKTLHDDYMQKMDELQDHQHELLVKMIEQFDKQKMEEVLKKLPN